MKKFWDKMAKIPLWGHLLLAAALAVVLLFGTLKWLEIYTHHNEAVVVPDVKGLTLDKANDFFKSSGLRYSVIDSVFSKDVAPGAIVEIDPSPGSKVKEGRIIFITLNAITSQMASVPEVADLSLRQAYALLRARGFESVTTEYVPGEYKDLVISVETRGRAIQKDELLPLNAPLVIIVSSGMTEEQLFPEDSLEFDEGYQYEAPVESLDSDEENWF